MAKTVEVEMARENETKNKQRFAEDAESKDAVIGKLYVSKAGDKKLGNPKAVKVTITAVK